MHTNDHAELQDKVRGSTSSVCVRSLAKGSLPKVWARWPSCLVTFRVPTEQVWSDGATEPIGLVVPVDVLADAPSVVLNTSRACDVQPEMGSSYPQDADATQKSEGLVRVRGGAALKMRVKAQ